MNQQNKIIAGTLTAALVSAVTLFEGTRTTPYEDIAGVLTVCTGHTGKDVVKGSIYTPAQCQAMLEKDLKVYRAAVNQCVNVPISGKEFDAYTMFTYNVGGTAFCNSSLLKKLNAGQHTNACNGLTAWSYSNGKYVQGLNNRRKFEQQMCLGGVNGK